MQQLNAPSVRWEWISEAWNLFTRQWSVWVLMILVMALVGMAIYLPFFGIFMAMTPSFPQDGEIPTAPEFPVGLFMLYPVLILAILSASAWMLGGIYNAACKQIRGEQIAVGDLFSGGQYFGRILGALLLIAIAANIGGIFCLIPGLIVYGLTFLTYPMIVEGGKGTIDAIKASIEVTKRDWIMFTIFAVALYLIAIAGSLACGIGVLATLPLLFLSQALAYRDLVGMPGAQGQGQFMPPPPPPDYRDYAPSQTPAQPQSPSWSAPGYVSTPTPESAAKTCPHCGATLARAVNFCNQCGRPLRGA
jgi:zinc-ribbon domain